MVLTVALSPSTFVLTIFVSVRLVGRSSLSCCLHVDFALSPVAPVVCSMKSLVRRSSQSLSASRALVALTKSRTVCSASSLSLPPPHAASPRAASRTTVMRRATASVLPEGRAGVEFEDRARDLHVVARLEPGRLERAHHAHRPEALLDVAHRLVVVGVVAGYEPLDPLPLHPKRSRRRALDLERLAGAGAVDAVDRGGLVLGLGWDVLGHVHEYRVRELLDPGARCGRGGHHVEDRTAQALAPVVGGRF